MNESRYKMDHMIQRADHMMQYSQAWHNVASILYQLVQVSQQLFVLGELIAQELLQVMQLI